MSLFRRTSSSCLVLALFAHTGCAFDDPNAPPPPDECVKKYKGPAEARLWAIVDGPPSCATTNPARPEGDDTIVHFTGGRWNAEAAHCRAIDVFLGAVEVGDPRNEAGVPQIEIQRNFEIPLDAIGYCIVNKGTPSEIVAYSTCGYQSAGEGACEETLVNTPGAEITAEWFNCPGGDACAPASEDACLAEAGDGKAYAAYVDDPDFFCTGTPNEGKLSDAQDTIMVITGTRYKQSSAICLAASTYDSKAGLAFGVGPMARLGTRDANNVPVLDPTRNHPIPNGLTDGYCLFNKGLAEEFVLYSMCSGKAPVEATDGGMPTESPTANLTRQQRCAGTMQVAGDGGTKEESVWGNRVPSPRKGEWVACPGGPLCNLPLAQ